MKKTAKALLLTFLLVPAFLLGACNKKTPFSSSKIASSESDSSSLVPQAEDSEIRDIYNLYLAAGGNLSYEEWLATIKGEKGDIGPQGEPGKPGSSLLTGRGEPSSGLGNDGDSYIDTSSWNYYLKINGTWTLQGNIKGESSNYDNPQGLDFYLQDDDTYAVSIGNAIMLSNIVIPSTYCGKPVTSIASAAFSPASYNIGLEQESGWTSKLKTIVIPDSVTSLGKYAFYGCSLLEMVVLSDNVISIPSFAFYGCQNLKTINFPSKASSIGDNAFAYCQSLENIEITNSVLSIGEGAFSGCSSLKNVKIPSGITIIKERSFYECSSLIQITIPDSVITIEYGAFSGCSSLVSLIIPDSVISIGDYAFSNCSSLKTIVVGRSVGEIASNVFSGCYSIESLSFAKENSPYLFENGALYNIEKTELLSFIGGPSNEFIIPSTVTAISDYAFSNSSSLKSIVIPDTVETIGRGIFQGCSNLESITLPFIGKNINENVNLASYFFNSSDVSSLKSITISDRCVSVEIDALAYLVNLESLTIPFVGESATSNQYLGYIFGANSYRENEYVVPASLKRVKVSKRCTSIAKNAFYGCRYIEELGLSFIGGSATSNQYLGYIFGANSYQENGQKIPSSLKTIDISDGLKKFPYYEGLYDVSDRIAFVFRGSLSRWLEINNEPRVDMHLYLNGNDEETTSIVLPEGLTAIPENAFAYCVSITSVVIPNTVVSIGSFAFIGCFALENIQLSNNLEFIGSSAFAYCTSLKTISLPDTIKTVQGSVFSNCTSLQYNNYHGASYLGNDNNPYLLLVSAIDKTISSCEVHEQCYFISDYAFSGCNNLNSISISKGVEYIGSVIFSSCTALGSISVDQDNQYFCAVDNVLYNKNMTQLIFCSRTKQGTFVVPTSVISISEYAFMYCTDLTKLIIPSTISYIGRYAFIFCESLEYITLPLVNNGQEFPNLFSYYQSMSGFINLKMLTINGGLNNIDDNTFAYSPFYAMVISNNVTSIGLEAFANCNNLSAVFYEGTESELLSALSLGREDMEIYFRFKFYSYSETDPGIDNLCWHYVDGVPTIWGKKVVIFKDSNGSNYSCMLLNNDDEPVYSGMAPFRDEDYQYQYEFTGWDQTFNVGNLYVYMAHYNKCSVGLNISENGRVTYFDNFQYLSEVLIPESWNSNPVTAINNGAFAGDGNIYRVIIPASVTSIGADAFGSCYNLSSVFYGGTEGSLDFSEAGLNENVTIYYYSETQPTEPGNYWHYNNYGQVTIW